MEKKDIDKLLELPLAELIARADKVRKRFAGNKVELCNILNAKSGLCPEDCKFCAQSARHKTGAGAYPLKSKAEMLEAARRAKEIGAERFDIVTSGDKLSPEDFGVIVDAIRAITAEVKIKMCASLGSLGDREFSLLKEAGLSRYHHNLESSPRFFPKIVSTHTFEDRLKTIKAAKKSGLEVCSGGIIGMGETMDDRIQMALILKELKVDSVPLNILVPIAGTPLADNPVLSGEEVIRTIAIFRIILKDKIIKIAAGRESIFKDFQALGFMAGANGMLIGGYLTIKGRSVEEDRKLVDQVEKLWQA
ncbi:MAG: biotin synthase BioB [Candidatus Omnitrophota bacterium]|nr:biotin synthase BioB [Candidatus Omnitrophota bacterium]